MLTKTDLNQIRGIVHDEVDKVVNDKLDIKLKPIKRDIGGLRQDIGGIRQNLSGLAQGVTDLQKDMKNVKKDLRYVRKTLNVVVKNYDEGDVLLGRRVTKIEEHLQI